VSRMNRLPGALVALLLLAPTARAADPGEVAAAKRALAAAVDSASAGALVKARAGFAGLSAAEPENAALHLWVATATWRAVPLLQRAEPARAEKLLRDGLRHADQAVRLDPRSGEALALMAALQGIHSLHKPAEFGGSASLARQQLEHALALFAKAAPVDSAAFDWGEADALLWAGQAAGRSGDRAAAVSFYERALERSPGNRWVGKVLLPAARDSLAKARP